MIQSKTLEKFIEISPEIAEEAGTDPEIARKVLEAVEKRINKYRRHPREPAPEGGISIRAASRKYHISHAIISIWCKNGYLVILKKTPNWIYIDENSLLKHLEHKNSSNH